MRILPAYDHQRCDYCDHREAIAIVTDSVTDHRVCQTHLTFVTARIGVAAMSRAIFETRLAERESVEWRKGMHDILRGITIAADSFDRQCAAIA